MLDSLYFRISSLFFSLCYLSLLSLSFCSQYSRLGATLNRSCSLCYNGAVLQALTVHLCLQGLWDSLFDMFLCGLSEVIKDELAVRDLNEPEFPFCYRLHRVKDVMERNSVSIEEVISELGHNNIAALHSVPTAMFCVLHCLEPRDGLPNRNSDTDTIAIAGAHYGIYTISQIYQPNSHSSTQPPTIQRHFD
uniref:Uncharacterized protein n=1 Tax=Hucho hucho TaxID=62062 RepID=A0A4W5LY81_9TELE